MATLRIEHAIHDYGVGQKATRSRARVRVQLLATKGAYAASA
jgi:hypothetical protein